MNVFKCFFLFTNVLSGDAKGAIRPEQLCHHMKKVLSPLLKVLRKPMYWVCDF